MLTKKLIFLLGGLSLALQSLAQDSLLLRDYRFVKQRDTWLTSENPASLVRFDSENIAEAEVSLTHQRGGFTNFDASPNVLQVNTSVESFYRVTRRTVLYGGISYKNFSGKEMAGSVFTLQSSLSPHRPFDIVEDSLTNTGTKHLDIYQLTGGFGSRVFERIAIGARFDYTAANYAKYKDLRHQNKLMDLKATGSIYAPVTDWLNVGIHYQYHRHTESVSFSVNGKTDKIYKSLIDYGGFFGKVEQFGSEGFTDKSREMPFFKEGHGGGLQAEVRPLGWLSVFAGITRSHYDGYYGHQSPHTIQHSRHKGDNTELTASLRAVTGASEHHLDFVYSDEQLENKAETYRELKNASGATYFEYYDPVETGDKHWQEGQLTYTGNLLIQGEMPLWTLQAGINWSKRRQTAYLYPFYRYQKLSRQEYSVLLTRNIIGMNSVWSFTLQGSFAKGSGEPYTDGIFTTTGSINGNPPTMEAYLMREYHFLTAPQYSIGGEVKYAFIFPRTSLKTYTRLMMNHRKANATNEYSNGNDHTMVTVAVGCTF